MASTSRFRLTSSLSDSDKVDRTLREYYGSWRENNQNSKSPFIALDNGFKEKHLKDLEPGPLKLYLFFSFAANNDHGHSWHSIQSMADFFETKTRTIDNWIRVLVEKELIYRAQKGNRSHTTYLIPFTNTMIRHRAPKKRKSDNQELLDDLIKKIMDMESVYGEIIKVCHLFQWLSRKGKPVTGESSTQELLIITRRTNGVLIGHLHTLRKSDHLSVDELFIDAPCIFESPFSFNESNIVGIALPAIPSLKAKTSIKDTLGLIEDLATAEDWEIEDHRLLKYGDKDEMLSILEEEDVELDVTDIDDDIDVEDE